MGGFPKMIDDQSESLSRFEVHKKLKNWHFDPDSTKQDYYIVKHINRPAEFWQSGIDELLTVDPLKLGNGWFSKPTQDDAVEKDSKYYAIQSLHNDVRLAGAPKGDNWFDRRALSRDNILSELIDEIDLDAIDLRFGTQNPMDMTYRHIDHEHSQVAPKTRLTEDTPQSLEEVFTSRGNWVKYIVLLHDLFPGQVMYWGNSVIKAKQGDVIAWDYGVPHWTVNFSNYPRHVGLITGKKRS